MFEIDHETKPISNFLCFTKYQRKYSVKKILSDHTFTLLGQNISMAVYTRYNIKINPSKGKKKKPIEC